MAHPRFYKVRLESTDTTVAHWWGLGAALTANELPHYTPCWWRCIVSDTRSYTLGYVSVLTPTNA